MIKQYETVFIMTPILSEEETKETVGKFLKALKDKGAEIIFENNWGIQKLAYPIQKKATGYYYLVEYKVEGDAIADLETGLKREEKIIRFLTTLLDKHSIQEKQSYRKIPCLLELTRVP